MARLEAAMGEGGPDVPDESASHSERLVAAETTLRDMKARRAVMRERTAKMLERADAMEAEQKSWKQALANIEDVAVSPRSDDAGGEEGGEVEGKRGASDDAVEAGGEADAPPTALDAELERLEKEALRAYAVRGAWRRALGEPPTVPLARTA